MQPFFISPNHLLLFSFKHIMDIERERNVMTLEKELEEIGKFLKKIKNINCVKQNKIFVVIDGKVMSEDVNCNNTRGTFQSLFPLYTHRGFNETEIKKELKENDAELLQKEVKNKEYIVEEDIDKEVGFKRIKIVITLNN